jgi:hypothetical protein
LPPKAERVAGKGNPIAIPKVPTEPFEIATNHEDIQQRRLARRFLLLPDTAATIARLAYGAQ